MITNNKMIKRSIKDFLFKDVLTGCRMVQLTGSILQPTLGEVHCVQRIDF